MKRYVVPLILGLGGIAVLLSLGLWQLRRLEWKQTILAQIETKITDAAVALPVAPQIPRDRYLPVTAQGRLNGPILRVLASRKQIGAGYRLITAMDIAATAQPSANDQTAPRRVLVDLGFIRLNDVAPVLPKTPITLIGNLHWPDETDSYTPEPDRTQELWFARDVPLMAEALHTEPVMIVLRSADQTLAPITPIPVGIEGIPNDHREYAITWFSLAAIWLAMTIYLLYRIRRPDRGETT